MPRSHLECDPRLAAALSLWPVLHDGLLQKLGRDGARLSMVIDVPHVRAHAGLPPESRFRLECAGVRAIDAVAWALPATPPPVQEASESREAHHAREDAWRERGTFPALAVEQVLAELTREEAKLRISAAAIADDPAGTRVILWIAGMLHPEEDWRELRIEARSCEVHEGVRTLDRRAFVALGEAYWDDWSRRSSVGDRR